MKILDLQKIERLYFGHEDIARALGITLSSAKVSANRYTRLGVLIRIKRNLYILREKWINLDEDQRFLIANLIQTPSYISLTTALEYYEITTQVQQNFVESIATLRTKEVRIERMFFRFTKIRKDLYFGFVRSRGFFIAEPEKAFLDSVYLTSFGKYSLDVSSIDYDKLSRSKIGRMARSFPLRTRRLLKQYESIREA